MKWKLKKMNKKILSIIILLFFLPIPPISVGANHISEVMIVIQAHTDDFDLALSGIAMDFRDAGGTVIICTVTDCGVGHYYYGIDSGAYEHDRQRNKTVYAGGTSYIRPFYSKNCQKCRLEHMRERYKEYGFIPLTPRTKVPDMIELIYDANPENVVGKVMRYYARNAEYDLYRELGNELQRYKNVEITFYTHDPTYPEIPDHMFVGKIGEQVYRRLKYDKNLYYYYVYRSNSDVRKKYKVINMKHRIDDKRTLLNKVWESGDPYAKVFKWIYLETEVRQRAG